MVCNVYYENQPVHEAQFYINGKVVRYGYFLWEWHKHMTDVCDYRVVLISLDPEAKKYGFVEQSGQYVLELEDLRQYIAKLTDQECRLYAVTHVCQEGGRTFCSNGKLFSEICLNSACGYTYRNVEEDEVAGFVFRRIEDRGWNLRNVD